MKNRLILFLFLLFFSFTSSFTQEQKNETGSNHAATSTDTTTGKDKSKDFVVRKPGEIFFYTGAVIEGHIEKPQVMIVFPKEKAKLDSIIFDNSFEKEMLRPLPIKDYKELN